MNIKAQTYIIESGPDVGFSLGVWTEVLVAVQVERENVSISGDINLDQHVVDNQQQEAEDNDPVWIIGRVLQITAYLDRSEEMETMRNTNKKTRSHPNVLFVAN